ncbi:MAG: hypothetical protein M1830_004485 [Pleopsidium flavum]|nr:MAG: hypothetical protein M1830_006043 [Pleopsidium flavum]KAI9877227.1 MAG: hypothetical protein M1830_004485 [Pleopsidium flavum]
MSNNIRNFRIELYTPSKTVLIPGDKVTGSVILASPRDEAVGSVEIAFRGLSKSKITPSYGYNKVPYRNQATLFESSKTLYRGHYTLRANSYEWPFEFTFPSLTLPKAGATKWKPSQSFAHEPSHALPPTFLVECLKVHGPTENYIHYELAAILRRPSSNSVFHFGTLKDSVALPFTPFPTVESPDPKLYLISNTYTRQSHLLDPDVAGQSLTLKEKVRFFWNHKQQPKSTFAVKVELPQVACNRGILPIFIGVEHNLALSTAPALPIVYLRRVHIRLIAFSFIRCPHLSIFGDHDKEEVITDRINIIDNSFPDTPITERMSLSELLPHLKLSGSLPPSFRTFNSARSYRLVVKVIVECAQKIYKAEVVGHGLLVMPGVFKPENVSRVDQERPPRRTGVYKRLGRLMHVDEPLPRYEAICASPEPSASGEQRREAGEDVKTVKAMTSSSAKEM